MKPLVDGDILVYEIGYAAEAAWQQAGFPPFHFVADMFDMRIANICAIVDSTQPPTIYLTGKGNFRYEIAKKRPYKERPSLKPFHYKNLIAYIKAVYDTRISEGMEADDLMAIEQTRRLRIPYSPTIICTRDKDLRQVPGWTYGWELGNQPSFGPMYVDEIGEVQLSADRKKLRGYGMIFFYSQCLTGDAVDTVPGLGGIGPVGAFKILEGCRDTQEAFKRVLEAYRAVYGDDAEKELLEQGRLLWMTRDLCVEGMPILWELPDILNSQTDVVIEPLQKDVQIANYQNEE